MEGNKLCWLCKADLAAQFCICSNLPLLCSSCKATHETKPGFHFSLPIEALAYVCPQNQQQYRLWLVSVANSQEKLRENVQLIDQCREEISALYVHIQAELDKSRILLLQTLEELKIGLSGQIEEAIREVSANVYLANYETGNALASLMWTHSCQNSSEAIPAFVYQVKPDMEALSNLLGVEFHTPIAALGHLNFGNERRKPNRNPEIRKAGKLDGKTKKLLEKYEKNEIAHKEIENSLRAQIKEMKGTLKFNETEISRLQKLLADVSSSMRSVERKSHQKTRIEQLMQGPILPDLFVICEDCHMMDRFPPDNEEMRLKSQHCSRCGGKTKPLVV